MNTTPPKNLLSVFKRVRVCRLGECVSPRAAVVSHSKQMLRVKLRNASLVRRTDRQTALQDGCDCLRRCLTLSVSLLLFLSLAHMLQHIFCIIVPAFGILWLWQVRSPARQPPQECLVVSARAACVLRGEHRCMWLDAPLSFNIWLLRVRASMCIWVYPCVPFKNIAFLISPVFRCVYDQSLDLTLCNRPH